MRTLACAVVTCGMASAVRAQSTQAAASPRVQQQAYVTAARGQVSIVRDEASWAISSGERIPIQRLITTGDDGYARLEVKGGAFFEVYANSRIAFRQNAATSGDLLDVLAGRVRVHLNPTPGEAQQRVFCAVASIAALLPATIAIAIDEDDTARIDVLEGEVRIQHRIRPRSDPTVVKAIDAILVQRDEQISRRMDRGTLYRYTLKPLHDLFSAVTPGHSSPKVQEQEFQCEHFLVSTLTNKNNLEPLRR